MKTATFVNSKITKHWDIKSGEILEPGETVKVVKRNGEEREVTVCFVYDDGHMATFSEGRSDLVVPVVADGEGGYERAWRGEKSQMESVEIIDGHAYRQVCSGGNLEVTVKPIGKTGKLKAYKTNHVFTVDILQNVDERYREWITTRNLTDDNFTA